MPPPWSMRCFAAKSCENFSNLTNDWIPFQNMARLRARNLRTKTGSQWPPRPLATHFRLRLGCEYELFLFFSVASVTAPVAHFISLEMGNLVNALGRFLVIADVRTCASVAALDVVTVVHVTLEIFRTMKPLAGADAGAAGKPFRAVVTVGRAGKWGIVIVAVRQSGAAPMLTPTLTWAAGLRAPTLKKIPATAAITRYLSLFIY
jgi:hypothetical protein